MLVCSTFVGIIEYIIYNLIKVCVIQEVRTTENLSTPEVPGRTTSGTTLQTCPTGRTPTEWNNLHPRYNLFPNLLRRKDKVLKTVSNWEWNLLWTSLNRTVSIDLYSNDVLWILIKMICKYCAIGWIYCILKSVIYSSISQRHLTVFKDYFFKLPFTNC